jgi:hypothetical protein
MLPLLRSHHISQREAAGADTDSAHPRLQTTVRPCGIYFLPSPDMAVTVTHRIS